MARVSLKFSVMAEDASSIRDFYVTAWDGPTQVVGIFPWHAAVTTNSSDTLQASNPPNTGLYTKTSPTGEAGWQLIGYRNFGQGEYRNWSNGILALRVQNTTPGSSHRTVHVLGPGGVYGRVTMWFA